MEPLSVIEDELGRAVDEVQAGSQTTIGTLRTLVAEGEASRADTSPGSLAALGGQAFPFAKSGWAVRQGLEEMGRWLNDRYAVIISPEGAPERAGKLLPFLGARG